jgi:hypothetical protein
MAHFAKINYDGTVTSVLAVDNDSIIGSSKQEEENNGIEFLTQLMNYPFWIQTSYNGSFRKNFAGIGYTYDSARDAFIPPQPYPSWTLDEDTCTYEAPTPYPILMDEYNFEWDEDTTSWVEVTE